MWWYPYPGTRDGTGSRLCCGEVPSFIAVSSSRDGHYLFSLPCSAHEFVNDGTGAALKIRSTFSCDPCAFTPTSNAVSAVSAAKPFSDVLKSTPRSGCVESLPVHLESIRRKTHGMTHGTSLFFDVTCHALQQAVISNLPMLSCAPPHGQTTLSPLVRVATQLCCLLVAPEILQNSGVLWCTHRPVKSTLSVYES